MEFWNPYWQPSLLATADGPLRRAAGAVRVALPALGALPVARAAPHSVAALAVGAHRPLPGKQFLFTSEHISKDTNEKGMTITC